MVGNRGLWWTGLQLKYNPECMARKEETVQEAEITVRARSRGLTLPRIRERTLQADWGRARAGSGG